MRVSATLNTSAPRQDGTCPIRVEIAHNGRTRRGIGIWVSDRSWDAVRGRVKISHPRQGEYNARIAAMIDRIEQVIDTRPELTADEVWDAAQRRTGEGIVAVFRDIATNRPGYADGSREVLHSATNWVERAIPHVRIGTLTVPDVVLLRRTMEEAGLHPNTVRNRMSKVRTMYNLACEDRGLSLTSAFRRQMPKGVKGMPKNITVEDVHRVAGLELDGRVKMARDVWMLSLYLGGLRVIDVLKLKRHDLHDGGVLIRVKKTGDPKWLPLIGPAQAILDGFDHKGVHLVPLGDRMTYDSAKSDINLHLKVVAQLAGLTSELSMRWARGSCTNYLLSLEVPLDVVQMILGHARIQQTIDYAAQFDRKRVREALEKVGRAIPK